MILAPEAEPGKRPSDDLERERERERRVRHDTVDPERRDPVHDDAGREQARMQEDARSHRRIAAHRERPASCEQREDGDAGDHRAVVEAMLDVQDEQHGEQRHGDLPGAPVAEREAARCDDERDCEWSDERLRDAVHVSGVDRRDERCAVLGKHRVEQREEADEPDERGKRGARASPHRIPGSPEDRSCDSSESGRQCECGLGRRCVERGMGRDLPDDEDRDAVQRVVPADDAGGEE